MKNTCVNQNESKKGTQQRRQITLNQIFQSKNVTVIAQLYSYTFLSFQLFTRPTAKKKERWNLCQELQDTI